MKTTLLLVLALSSFVALGADTPAPSNASPATITGVSAAKDKRKLVIRYEQSSWGDHHRGRRGLGSGDLRGGGAGRELFRFDSTG
jgi:hypothetical protein